MAKTETLITFVIYLIFLVCVGIYFYKKTKNAEDYIIGGRGVGSWVTALSAQASDMSGWLLMGLPGAVYLSGMSQFWVILGLGIGTYLNWRFIAGKLRIQTEETKTMTIPNFLSTKLGDKKGYIRTFSAIVILFFFTIYSASGLVAAGKLFESILGIDYRIAVLIGGSTVIAYTFMGGYLACCWTDFFQGALMFFAIILVPTIAFFHTGGATTITHAMSVKHITFKIFNGGGKTEILTILSSLAWGFGYFGQPHILSRFMSVKSLPELRKARSIAMVWVVISLIGAVAIGITGIAMFKSVSELNGDAEKVFIYMINVLFNPWISGIFLAAILSAIMSTIDSQLLVSASTLTEDFYRYMKKSATEKELLWTGRICILVISAIAYVIALNPNARVLSMVAYAWAGFGGVFGPAIIMTLYMKKLNYKSVLWGMVVGTIIIILWKVCGLSDFLYEIIPAFVINLLVIYLIQKYYEHKK